MYSSTQNIYKLNWLSRSKLGVGNLVFGSDKPEHTSTGMCCDLDAAAVLLRLDEALELSFAVLSSGCSSYRCI